MCAFSGCCDRCWWFLRQTWLLSADDGTSKAYFLSPPIAPTAALVSSKFILTTLFLANTNLRHGKRHRFAWHLHSLSQLWTQTDHTAMGQYRRRAVENCWSLCSSLSYFSPRSLLSAPSLWSHTRKPPVPHSWFQMITADSELPTRLPSQRNAQDLSRLWE